MPALGLGMPPLQYLIPCTLKTRNASSCLDTPIEIGYWYWMLSDLMHPQTELGVAPERFHTHGES
jgi:hypothetical protein